MFFFFLLTDDLHLITKQGFNSSDCVGLVKTSSDSPVFLVCHYGWLVGCLLGWLVSGMVCWFVSSITQKLLTYFQKTWMERIFRKNRPPSLLLWIRIISQGKMPDPW